MKQAQLISVTEDMKKHVLALSDAFKEGYFNKEQAILALKELDADRVRHGLLWEEIEIGLNDPHQHPFPLFHWIQERMVVSPYLNRFRDHQDLHLSFFTEEDCLDLIEFLLERGANINHKDPYRNTNALFMLASRGQHKMASFLISKGIDVHDLNAMDNSALHAAVVGAGEEMIDLLIGAGVDVHGKNKGGYTPLKLMFYHQRFELASWFIKKYRPDFFIKEVKNHQESSSWLVLLLADKNKASFPIFKEILSHLKDSQLPPNQAILIAMAESPDYYNLLSPSEKLEWKALVGQYIQNEKDKEAVIPLHSEEQSAFYIACENRFGELAAMLFKAGWKVDWADAHCNTALHIAAAHDHQKEVMDLVTWYGANVNAFNENGHHALSIAISSDDHDIIKHLIEAGSNLYSLDRQGNGLLHGLRSSEEHLQWADLLISKGLSLDAPNAIGNTPLHEAVIKISPLLVEHFIASGANIHLKNKDQKTALNMAHDTLRLSIDDDDNIEDMTAVISVLERAELDETTKVTSSAVKLSDRKKIINRRL